MPSPEAEAFILAHADRPYNAVQAHEYYMRRRQLVGRKPAAQFTPKGRPSAGAHFGPPTPRKTQATKTAHQRQKEIEAKVGLMKVRLAKLQQVLENLTKKVKAEAGTAKPKAEKASGDKKLTGSEKTKAAKAAKEYREKHKKDTEPSSETQEIQQKIEATLKKIEAARVKLSKSRSAKPAQFTKAT
jgi:hypothetical protein